MLKYRLPSGIVLISLLLISIFWKSDGGKYIFMLFGALMAFGAVMEFLNMLSKVGKESYPKATALAGAIGISSIFLFDKSQNIPFLLFTIAIISPWFLLLFSKLEKNVLIKILNSLTAIFMVVLPISFLAIIYMTDKDGIAYSGRYLVFFMILVTKLGDIGAYFTGTTCNTLSKGKNHKIVPFISPKKSWEGTIGGCVLSMVGAVCISKFMLPSVGDMFTLTQTLVLGFLLFVGGFTGDLVESCLKRISGVKDSGSILPGMGGVMDVLDSLLLNAPLFYYLITYVM